MVSVASELLPGEKADLLEEAVEVLGDQADAWLDTPVGIDPLQPDHPEVTRRRLAQSADEAKRQVVRNELRGIKYGIFT